MKKRDLEAFFTHNLMHWNKALNNRKMPWKGETDAYKIWLSEIILQQTRVDQGLQYYNRFIKKYPTVKDLAAAKESDVFKLWEGLGYYSRCKNLITTARHIAIDLNGKFPNDYFDILKLKGIGPYTAAAIASFAYNQPYAVVDGNVTRVLSRFFGIEKPIDSTVGKSYFTSLASDLLDKERAALYNQAIMDFGATVCKPKLPLCSDCVLRLNCRALAKNLVDVLPIKEKKLIKKDRWFYYIIADYGGKFFVRKRIGKDIWQNLYEFILIEENKKIDADQIFESSIFKNIISGDYIVQEITRFYTQKLTHQTIHGCFIHVTLMQKPVLEDYILLSRSKLEKLAFPKFINNFLKPIQVL